MIDAAGRFLAIWGVPIGMTICYAFLAYTAETDASGQAWMAIGLGFVFVIWFVFRLLAERAALHRALGVGDTVRLFALADKHLARARKDAARAPFLVARAFAYQLRGDMAQSLATIEQAHPDPELAPLAQLIKINALVELDRPIESPIAPAPRTPSLVWLAEGELAWRSGDREVASDKLNRVIDDIRAGSATRAIARFYAARIADASGQPQVAAKHRAEITKLVPPDATWLRPT